MRYCFNSQATATQLAPIITGAIALWWPIRQYPQLEITPDTACVDVVNGKGSWRYDCVCEKQADGMETAGDTLLIDNQVFADIETGMEDWTEDTPHIWDMTIPATTQEDNSCILGHLMLGT
jgi:hypothetical protein